MGIKMNVPQQPHPARLEVAFAESLLSCARVIIGAKQSNAASAKLFMMKRFITLLRDVF
jgi:hypothetical protein